tara:strand:+ start:182 stop:694 length:513 start_codon:yes stop_codon:yes gene_type:complete
MNGLKKLGSKKGNVPLEAIIGMFLLFTIAIFWVVSSLVFTDITEAMVEDGDLDPIANTSITNLESRFSETFDGAFGLIFILLWIATLISAFYIDTSPVVFIISMTLLIILLVSAGFLGNAFAEVVEDSFLSSAGDKFPIMSFIMQHLVAFILLIGGGVGLVLYGKSRGSI